ncbi:MAG: cell division protein FtsW [Bdellovibrionales bacterium RBG_16_40_8]|nr:MAG: cell division protein FtsW [Bdellovibrionales bacterium RBG_16_40_8]
MNRELDRPLFLALLFLLGFGIVQIYSSSYIFAIESFDDGLFFVKKQALFVALALIVLLVTAYLPLQWVVKLGLCLWILSFIGVGLTLVPGLGVRVGGASRWLNIASGFRFEPSELLKYTYPLLLAFVFTREKVRLSSATQLSFAALPFLPLGLLIMQPDFGSVALLSVMILSILFLHGLRWRYVFTGLAVACLTFYFLIVRVDYRMARITAFLDPWSDPAQKGFQVIQSMLGFFSGGLTGVGLGQGQGKLFFLPEAHTDFTLSVLAEELGFIGILFVLSIFGFVMLRGFQIAARAKNEFEQTVALGVTIMFSLTAMVNAGVAMGVLPTKGLGIPFLSYGGSALVATCFGLGILLNIDRTQKVIYKKSFIRI